MKWPTRDELMDLAQRVHLGVEERPDRLAMAVIEYLKDPPNVSRNLVVKGVTGGVWSIRVSGPLGRDEVHFSVMRTDGDGEIIVTNETYRCEEAT